MRKTFGSRSNSSASASFNAWRYVISRICILFVSLFAVSACGRAWLTVGVGIVVKFLQRRLIALLGKFHRVQRNSFCFLVQFVKFLVGQFSFAGELCAQPSNRIIQPIFLQLLLRPVAGGIRHGVPAITVGADFDKSGMRIFAN